MTKPESRTKLKARARKHLLGGYFQPETGMPTVYVYCPDCRRKIVARMNLSAQGRYSAIAAHAVLVPSLVDHWFHGECG